MSRKGNKTSTSLLPFMNNNVLLGAHWLYF
jgi:hypothetical protein